MPSEIVTVCAECGVVDSDHIDPERPIGERLPDDPARAHYDRTGHTAGSFSVHDAPDEIRDAVARADLSEDERERITNWMKRTLFGGA